MHEQRLVLSAAQMLPSAAGVLRALCWASRAKGKSSTRQSKAALPFTVCTADTDHTLLDLHSLPVHPAPLPRTFHSGSLSKISLARRKLCVTLSSLFCTIIFRKSSRACGSSIMSRYQRMWAFSLTSNAGDRCRCEPSCARVLSLFPHLQQPQAVAAP